MAKNTLPLQYLLTTIVATALVVTSSLACRAQTAVSPQPRRTIPARPLPTPTDVSPQLQDAIAQPWQPSTTPLPTTNEHWKALAKATDAAIGQATEQIEKQYKVAVESKTVAGVHVYTVTPDVIAPENRNRLLVHVHGGGYVFFSGKASLSEAIFVAHAAHAEVLSIDYRMPPDSPFPAALDDTIAVWKEVLKTHPGKNLALFGTSAGGGLTLAAVLRMKELHLPLPAAIMAGTPWSDLTKTGDSYVTNEFIDNVLGSYDGMLEADAKLYAGTHDLKEPLLSPVYGDLTGFPPTILISGTRDLFLSNTVRVHQKLLQSNVEAQLLVLEGQSHADFLVAPDAPESVAAYREVARFFDHHLAK